MFQCCQALVESGSELGLPECTCVVSRHRRHTTEYMRGCDQSRDAKEYQRGTVLVRKDTEHLLWLEGDGRDMGALYVMF